METFIALERLYKIPILSTTIRKVQAIPNPVNVELLGEFPDYMRKNGSSEHHQNINLKAVIAFGNFLGKNSFYHIKTQQQVLSFLDTEVRTCNKDPDKKMDNHTE